MSNAELVEKFNNTIIGIDRKPGNIEDDEEFRFFIGSCIEELNELKEARENCDFIGQLDALADLLYFTYGGFTRMGIPGIIANKIFNAVHECNMAKSKGKKEARVFKHNLDAIKPKNWIGPEEKIMNILDNWDGKSE